MNKRVLLCVGLMALLVSSCTVGSRRVITENREVSGFDRVDFSTVGELTITQGERESLTIEAESNVMRRIKTEVRGDTLHIDMKSGFPWIWNIIPTKPIKYELTVRELSDVDLSGLGSIYAGGIEADRLNLGITGAGQIVIRSLSADALEVEHTGVGKCELSGQVRRQEVILTGAGDYDAADLESERAEVTVTGLGKTTVWVTEDLDIVLSGAGKVSYYGHPAVSQEVTGLGKVESLGNR
jgi:hypothetical protein